MPFTKRSAKAREDGPGSRLQIIMLLILSCGITSVAAVDVTGYAFNVACRGEGTFGCVGLPPSDCCGFDGLRPAQSMQFLGVPPGDYSYSWYPLLSDPDCGTIHHAERSLGLGECHRAGIRGMTGGSWSAGGHVAVSGDGTTVSIPRCKNVVKATPVRFNATSGSWYRVDNESSTSSNHTDNSRT